MPKSRRRRTPKYCHHKARNLARVNIDGKVFYLGEYNSPESKERYRLLISQWRERQEDELDEVQPDLRICELMTAFIKHCDEYYRKYGKLTREFGCITEALKTVRKRYELEAVDDFGPKALKSVRDDMIGLGWSRKYINKQIGRIVRMFKWGVGEQKVRPSTWHALQAVEGLKKGRTIAPEHPPIEPVSDKVINATLRHLSDIVGDMVRIQKLAGCRPIEICLFRPMDIDQSGDIWRFVPDSHKNEHLDKVRLVWLGPLAQEILRKYLIRPADSYCFNPREAPNVRSNTGYRYTKDSYGRAVRRASEKAGVEKWSPNRLRHSAATRIRKQFGLEAAQTVLGHASANVTEIYAERDMKLAAEIARKLG